MSVIALPYKTPSANSIGPAVFLVDDGTGLQELPDRMTGWSADTTLVLRAMVDVDLDAVLSASDLERSSRVGVRIAWSCPRTNQRGTSEMTVIDPGHSGNVSVDATVPGDRIGWSLDVDVAIVAVAPVPSSPLGTDLRGSVLWRSPTAVDVEGDAARLPMENASFREFASVVSNSCGPWFIKVDDPDLPVSSGIRVYINDDHRAVSAALSGIDQSDHARALAERSTAMLREDLLRTLIDVAVDPDGPGLEFDEDAAGSVRFAGISLVSDLFPELASAEEVRALRDARPAEFHDRVRTHLIGDGL